MARCKDCGRSISRLDNDLCPYCGAKHPISSGYETMDMTSFIDPLSGESTLYKSKSQKVAGLLSIFLGVFGVHDFYLGFWQKALVELCLTLSLTGILGVVLLLVFEMNALLSFLLPFAALFIYYVIYGIVFLLRHDLKDANGEFLR